MIIRILNEGQYELDEALGGELDALDKELAAAIDSGDEVRFDAALSKIESTVRTRGHALDASDLVPSDLTLPHSGATIEEVRELLAEPTEES